MNEFLAGVVACYFVVGIYIDIMTFRSTKEKWYMETVVNLLILICWPLCLWAVFNDEY